MPLDPRKVTSGSPAPVAIHDDGDVRGQAREVDLSHERFLGRPWRDPFQDLFERHTCASRGEV
jgi:hypothetical protein